MANGLKFLDHSFLSRLASQSSNGSAHWSIKGNSGRVSYDFVALQSNTYVRPHCHPSPLLFGPHGSQLVILLSGKIGIIFIDEKTGTMKKTIMSASRGTRVVEIPPGVYHSCVSLSPNAVVLEIVEPGVRKRYLKGSPKPGTPEAKQLVKLWTGSLKAPFKSALLGLG
jgi:cupin fold WbuC family metalloprotein